MHLTAVVDGGTLTMTLYLGGVAQIRQPIPEIILPGNCTLRIGNEQNGTGLVGPLQGAVDEIRIFGRALNAAEILRLDAGP